MRIGIQTWGSDGDVRPMLALAGGLTARGHEVTFAATSVDNRDYRPLAANLGVRFERVVEHVTLDMADFGRRYKKTLTSLSLLKQLLDASFYAHFDEIAAASERLAAGNDLVIGHFFLYTLKAQAARFGRPYATVTFCHGMLPTAYRPPLVAPNLGRTSNRALWALVGALFNSVFRSRVNVYRQTQGFPAVRDTMAEAMMSEELNIVAASRVFCEEPPDWGERTRSCGFLAIPEGAEAFPTDEGLEKFIAEGGPPAYMTLGTPGQVVLDDMTELLVETARRLKTRSVIQGTSAAGKRDGDIYFAGQVAHSRVLSKAAAILHHGGAGTTHSAARAGRPSVVISFSDEQLFWGRELARVGIAAKPLSFKRATASLAAERLRYVLENETMRAEDGVARAVELVEQLALRRSARR